MFQAWLKKDMPLAPAQSEKARLKQLLDDIGIVRFDSRLHAGVIENEKLAQEVRAEYMRRVEDPGLLVKTLKFIFS